MANRILTTHVGSLPRSAAVTDLVFAQERGEAIDLAQLAKLDGESAREEIRDIVNEIIAIKNIVMSIAEQEELLDDICNDVLGYGPLEPLLARDDIADIMVNGSQKCYIEVAGKVKLTNVRFRDDAHLLGLRQ